ncbi:MAG: gpW family head-tail joining protein [Pseudomonadota bacterium]
MSEYAKAVAAIHGEDVCERARKLRTAYDAMIAGQQRVSVSFADRRVDYSQGDMDRLEREMRRAEDECVALQAGAPRRRFAIQAKGRRAC